jgi:NAD(P)-dependent dehydrogenase (short-subunit alcohol dehydrogenase family)
MPLEQFKQVVEVNLIGSFNLIRGAAADMICHNTMLNGEVIRLDGALRMAPR